MKPAAESFPGTFCEYLRGIALGPRGAARLPDIDLEALGARALAIAGADPDPRRPQLVLVGGVAGDLEPVLATLLSGRPLMVLDHRRDEALIEQARVAADALPVSNVPTGTAAAGRLITPGPEDVALIISTSGTTGSGKLWGRSQRGLMLQSAYQGSFLPAGDRLVFAPLGHFQATAAINALGTAMMGGASYRSLPVTAGDEQGMLEYLSREAPAFIACTPTIFRSLAGAADGLLPWDLRGVWFMGEPVKRNDLRLFRRVTRPGTMLRAHYGSTETGNIAVACLDQLDDRERSIVPSGPVSPLVELQILDEDGAVLPAGKAGRIAVRSPLLGCPIGHDAAGRWLPAAGGAPFFDLGDDGYLDADGTLFVLGRRDGVLKIGGVRVDAPGLEATISPLPGIREVAAVRVEGLSGGDVLAVAVHADDAVASERVRTQLQGVAGPESRAVVVDIGPFPVTAAQKVDLALVRQRVEEQLSRVAAGAPPVTPAEHLVANCWAEVLGIEMPARDVPLEALGGDSLALLSISLLLEQRFGLSVPDQGLDQCRTVAGLAAALRPRGQEDNDPPVFTLGGEGSVVLACCAGIGGHAWSFGPLAKAVSPGIEVLGVRWMEAAPEQLAVEIAALAGGRPVVPLGFSGGARSAWLIGQALRELGLSLPALVVLDGNTRQSIGRRHLGRAILRWLRPRSAADRYLLSLSYAGRRWHLGKQLAPMPLTVYEVRCPDRAGNHWGDPGSSIWSEFAGSVHSFDMDCEHQRIVKPPIPPEISRVVRLACGLEQIR